MSDPSEDSARKRELLDGAWSWVLAHGLGEMSLRPLAEAIGSSPRVLLYLFGSKDGLVAALLARSRAEQLGVLDAVRREDPAGGLAAVGARLWEWLADPGHRGLLALWLEAYSRSVGEASAGGGVWSGFAARTVGDWTTMLAAYQPPERRDSPAGVAERTLLLAVLRGALLDLLATGDAQRAGAAVHAHLAVLAQEPGGDPTRTPPARRGAHTDPSQPSSTS